MDDILSQLFATIESRRGGDESTSYTAQLLAQGVAGAGRKVNEEAGELLIATLKGDKQEISQEAADLLYHFLVLLAASEVNLTDVYAVLQARQGISGVAEKASRQQ